MDKYCLKLRLEGKENVVAALRVSNNFGPSTNRTLCLCVSYFGLSPYFSVQPLFLVAALHTGAQKIGASTISNIYE